MTVVSQSNDSTAHAGASPQEFASVQIRSVCFHVITEQECIRHIINEIENVRGGWVVTPNLDILRRCERTPDIRRLVHQADLVVPDGMPLIWASRIQGDALPERVTGSNLIHSLSAAAAEAGRSIYLLGGDEGTAAHAASVLRSRHPDLNIAGHECPPVGFDEDVEYMKALIERIRSARPDIVYVALGCPKQERLIKELRAHLPTAWWLGIGISFSFITGRVRRAPRWMQRFGLEWLHRLSQEPRRLSRRYLLEGLPFAGRLFAGAVMTRFGLAGPRRQAQRL